MGNEIQDQGVSAEAERAVVNRAGQAVTALRASIPDASSPKAYAIHEEYENTGGIVFAHHAVVARRIGAGEYADGEFDQVSCRRASWADCYADTGKVPVAAMVDNGWYFDCFGCGRRIDLDLYDEPGYESWSPHDIIGYQHTAAFCRQGCKDDHEAHEAERKRRQQRVIERFGRIVLRKFPDAILTDGEGYRAKARAYANHTKGRWIIEQVRVPFTYPGMQYGPGSLDYDRYPHNRTVKAKPHFTCAGGDVAAFEAWAAAHSRHALATVTREGGDAGSVSEANRARAEGNAQGGFDGE